MPTPSYTSSEIPGPSWGSGPLPGSGPPPTSHTPTHSHLPPPSPCCHKLRSPEEVLDQVSDWLVPASVGRAAIKLAKENVFGADVMAQGNLSEEGLTPQNIKKLM